MVELPPPRPAATLILMRESDGPPPELLFVERAASMAFAGGATVFPGGAVDAGDVDLARSLTHDLDEEDAAGRIAAIRETLEESGILVGTTAAPSPHAIAAMRQGLATGREFGALLQEHGVEMELERLVPFARWLPQYREVPKIYDTRFYLARAPSGQEGTPDQHESVRLFWASAQDVLARGRAGHAVVIYPTQRNLERLAALESFADSCANAALYPPNVITPFFEEREDGTHLCIPEGVGYPITSQPWEQVVRG